MMTFSQTMTKLNQHGGVLKSREIKSPYSKRNIEKHQDFMAMLEEKLKNKVRNKPHCPLYQHELSNLKIVDPL
jgi:hypothetical protein